MFLKLLLKLLEDRNVILLFITIIFLGIGVILGVFMQWFTPKNMSTTGIIITALIFTTIIIVVPNLITNYFLKKLRLINTVIDFILAYREFKERELNRITVGSDEWRSKMREFEESIRDKGKEWQILFQQQMEEELMAIESKNK